MLGVSAQVEPPSGTVSTEYTLTVNAYAGPDVASWNIDIAWGDGQSIGETQWVASPWQYKHRYAAAGTYTVSVMVYCPDISDYGTATTQVVVSSAPPAALTLNFIYDRTAGAAPLYVIFAVQGLGGAPDYWLDFSYGEGLPEGQWLYEGQSVNLLHTYASAGTFKAEAKLTDGNGTVAIKSVTITVSEVPSPETPILWFSADKKGGPLPVTVTFILQADLGTAPYGYTVNYGDGTYSTGSIAKARDWATLIHTYTAPLLSPVTATVTDSAGVVVTATLRIMAPMYRYEVSLTYRYTVTIIADPIVEVRLRGDMLSAIQQTCADYGCEESAEQWIFWYELPYRYVKVVFVVDSPEQIPESKGESLIAPALIVAIVTAIASIIYYLVIALVAWLVVDLLKKKGEAIIWPIVVAVCVFALAPVAVEALKRR